MKQLNIPRSVLLGLLALTTAAIASGCSSHTDAQPPAGMAVGPPLTAAQIAAANQVAANRHAQRNAPTGQ